MSVSTTIFAGISKCSVRADLAVRPDPACRIGRDQYRETINSRSASVVGRFHIRNERETRLAAERGGGGSVAWRGLRHPRRGTGRHREPGQLRRRGGARFSAGDEALARAPSAHRALSRDRSETHARGGARSIAATKRAHAFRGRQARPTPTERCARQSARGQDGCATASAGIRTCSCWQADGVPPAACALALAARAFDRRAPRRASSRAFSSTSPRRCGGGSPPCGPSGSEARPPHLLL